MRIAKNAHFAHSNRAKNAVLAHIQETTTTQVISTQRPNETLRSNNKQKKERSSRTKSRRCCCCTHIHIFSPMSSKPVNNNNQEYFSIEAPHKPRRQSYFWSIIITLTVLAGAVGVTFLSTAADNNNKASPTAALSHTTPSSDIVSNDYNNNNLDASSSSTKSYHVDMDKTEWPELVGKDAEIAKQTIQGENPSITRVQIVPEDAMVTMDYSTTRVRIFVKPDNSVARPPRVG